VSPFDESFKAPDVSLDTTPQEEPQTGRSRKTRDHQLPELASTEAMIDARSEARKGSRTSAGLSTVPLTRAPAISYPSLALPSSAPRDDFFKRKVSMPGTFDPSSAPAPSPACQPTAAHMNPSASSSFFSRPPATAASRPSLNSVMPGSFSTTPYPTPIASTSTLPEKWGEVTPSQLKKAVAELGFDLKDIGVTIAAERAWEENRGKELAAMVVACVEKLVH
jgi:hypothetical protein